MLENQQTQNKTRIILLSNNQSDLKDHVKVCEREQADPLRFFNVYLQVWQQAKAGNSELK